MDLSRLTYVMNEMRENIDKLVFLCSLKGTEYEKYIYELIPHDLNIHYSYYDDLDCVNDILVMTYKKYLDSEFDEWMGHIFLGDIIDTVNIDTLRYFLEISELVIGGRGIISAIEKKRLDIIRFLRESGYIERPLYDPNDFLLPRIVDEIVGDGLAYAIKYGTFEILDELVKMVPEHMRDGYEERISQLFGSYEASTDYPEYPEDRTIDFMKKAIHHGNLESAKWLHKRGLKIDLLDICMAVRLGLYDIAEWLKDNISEQYIEMNIEEFMKGSIRYGHDEVFNYLSLIVLGK